jgi:putative transcriptional regulator
MDTNIAKLRKGLGITQEKLAETCGVTRQTIIALEQGRYNPSLQLAYRVSKALKADRIEDVFRTIDG